MSNPNVDLYKIMKGRAYGIAQVATGCTNEDAVRRGFTDVYALIMSDSDHARQPAFLALLPRAIPSEGHRRVLLDGMAGEYTNLSDWMAYVDRESPDAN